MTGTIHSLSNQDQIAYWNGEAGARWVAEQERLDAMMAATTIALLDAADPQAGEHVLDVGCGCGTTSIALMESVGPNGKVLGLDVSAPMLEVARRRGREADLSGLTFQEADAATASLSPGTFDLLSSRFGVMFFADPVVAFRNLRRALKPSGRLAFVCWRDWRQNEWVRVPVMAVQPHVPPQPPLAPEDPGPFAFARIARLRTILAASGFDAITVRPLNGSGLFGETLEEGVQYLSGFGPISRMLGPASELERARAMSALREALRPFAAQGSIMFGLAQWLVTARVA
ncbi:MAG TPA: SAM-dependent methyltransferase [Alphaproteobacteria bacterium]|nr:SAM-dependent methyltransferase [Alphaproteobacteria bacterium]HAJ45466.1 SAM-dependent methyltransferase [Alphaproteobacteria bacterium]